MTLTAIGGGPDSQRGSAPSVNTFMQALAKVYEEPELENIIVIAPH